MLSSCWKKIMPNYTIILFVCKNYKVVDKKNVLKIRLDNSQFHFTFEIAQRTQSRGSVVKKGLHLVKGAL